MSSTLQIALPHNILLDAVSALATDEFDRILDEMLRIRARRIAPSISSSETKLLERIYAAVLSTDEQSRLQTLSQRLELETLDEDEYTELLTLNDQAEGLNVQRMEAVAELAIQRGQPLDVVLADLGMLYGGIA